MADPQPLVDQRDQCRHFGAAALGNLEVEGAGQMQRLDVAHPGVGDLVVGPLAGDQDGDLVVAGAFERPVVHRRQMLHHVERVDSWLVRVGDLGHDVSALPNREGTARARHQPTGL
jgi:hypothetical protein